MPSSSPLCNSTMSIVFLLVALLLSFSCLQGDGQPQGFECVDIHKQPAFDNVLLKNHKIQMSPSSSPKLNQKISESSFLKYSNFGAQTKGCPPGMVPIKKHTTRNQTDELRSFPRLYLGSNNIQPLTADRPGKHFAAMRTKLQKDRGFGARAIISVHNPPVKNDQVSVSQLWLESGQGAELNSLQVGWAVHPYLYGDNRTYLTACWTADNDQNTGCYNTNCPGFVQVHPTYVLGSYFGKISVYDGPQYITDPLVYQDAETGNWWLSLDNNKEKIGYWPKELFTHLNDGVEVAEFGGWTSSSGDGSSPPMGSGLFPDNHYHRSSYFAQIQIYNQDNELVNVGSLDSVVDNPKCYDVKYWKNQGGNLQETFSYGGPGGMCGT